MDEHTGVLDEIEGQVYNMTASHRQLGAIEDADSLGGSFGLLSKRDACSAAFGSGWINSFCAPGKTLCCVNERQRYPQCQQALGLGWCCTESQKGCYVDLESSSCGQPGAVQCSQLAEGVDEACCPQFTTCARNYNASTTWVRCDIRLSALQTLEASTSSMSGAKTKTQAETDSEAVQSTLSTTESSTPSSTQSSAQSTTDMASQSTSQDSGSPTTTSMSTTQAAVISSESATAPQSTSTEVATASSTQPFSMGATIGIAIAIAVAVLLLGVGAWFYLRKRAKAKRQWASLRSAQAPEGDAKFHGEGARLAWYNAHAPTYEMDDKTGKNELPGEQLSPKEMQGKEGVFRSVPVELEGSMR